ncbi:NUDIX domain-containing protein [Paenibacillus ginsengarvi]|uniref:NUDIX domain-containing protein n=1 Tax=Paenibacillus ginsengarvi TaxID=400777 RepID=A0A3B0C0L0_9BACL|nr:NUDIX domain-containing protein [Paenibacillus ginsengarvi]RKN79022.1 NUDIX domain-containing protein [Paenibacillus ginsengarvi]
MGISWEQSYLGQLRKLVGSRMLIAPAARAIIQDRDERILFVKRRDNGAWVMPAGGMELHESIFDCVKREVKEETGLDVIRAKPIALYTGPRFEYTNGYGDENKMFSVVFLVEEWAGELVKQTDETTDARFFATDELPEIPELYRETIEDLRNYRNSGTVILK